MTQIPPKTVSGVTGFWFCDRCDTVYQPHPDWPRCPLCPTCLIALRRTENTEPGNRPPTTREIEHAWRSRIFTVVA
jgi:hypothetical protein